MNCNQILNQTVKTSDLIKELENKNEDILRLNFKIQELEKTRNEMLIDLESYESEFQIAEKKFTAKENELNDKLQISELEKQNLINKLDYYQQMYPVLNSNVNVQTKGYLRGNQINNEDINANYEKLNLFYDFNLQLESLLLNKSSPKIVLLNIDCSALKYRLNQIIEATKNIINTKNEDKTTDLIFEKNNNENKSQR